MSSYQKRLQNIKYLEQCVRELREIAHELAFTLKDNNIEVPLLTKGIRGADFLTPYNSGDFTIELVTTMRIDLGEQDSRTKLDRAKEDPVFFVNETLGCKTTPWQEELMRKLLKMSKLPARIIRPHKE